MQTKQSVSRSLSCLDCLHATCGFCAAPENNMEPYSSLIYNATFASIYTSASRSWNTQAFPSQYGWLALVGLVFYIATFSPGMGPFPWAVNLDIYPAQYRGVCAGCNNYKLDFKSSCCAVVFIADTFIRNIWDSCMSALAMIFVFVAIPEIEGLSFQEVEALWEERAKKTNRWFP